MSGPFPQRSRWRRLAGVLVVGAVCALAAIVSSGSGVSSAATTASFTAVADASTAQDARSTNLGADPQLVNDNSRGHVHRSYLRFAVSGIPAGATITSASLSLTALQASSATASVKAVTGDWTEGDLTYANAPDYDSTVISRGTPSPIAAGTVTFDVTSLVKGDGTWDMVITQSRAGQTVWSSREGTSPPTLAVSYTQADDPTPTATPTETPTPTATPTPPPPESPAGGPCAGTTPPAAGYEHVVWILEENEAQSNISAANMPYMTGLAGACGRTSDLHAVTHPSLPNYIALTSGGTQGVTNDDSPAHWTPAIGDADNIFHQLGTDWKALQEGMPSNCALSSGGTRYAVRHNPAAYFANDRAACATQDVPYDSSETPDVSAAFTFITPDLCNDAHDCPLQTADDWLKVVVPKILSSPTYLAGDTVLVITFDEGVGADQTIYTTVVAPSVVPGTVSGAAYTHYSTLRATEDLLGLPPLGAAASAAGWADDFNLR